MTNQNEIRTDRPAGSLKDNTRITCSVSKLHRVSIDKLKQRWSEYDKREFSKTMCDASVIYGNLQNSKQGRNLILLLDRYAPELRYALYSSDEVDRVVVNIIAKYLKFNGIDFIIPDKETGLSEPAEVSTESPVLKNTSNEEKQITAGVTANESKGLKDEAWLSSALFQVDKDLFNQLD